MKNIRHANKGKGEARKPLFGHVVPLEFFIFGALWCGLVRFGAVWCGLVRFGASHASPPTLLKPSLGFKRNRPYRFYTDFIPVFRFLVQICEPTKSPTAPAVLQDQTASFSILRVATPFRLPMHFAPIPSHSEFHASHSFLKTSLLAHTINGFTR
jgi:hypothetical protein